MRRLSCPLTAILAEIATDMMLLDFNEKKHKEQIDKALDERNEEEFYRLTSGLKLEEQNA